ncbi:MAG: hypothetical protein BWY14_01313 [Parcubacteria group bacterium ADurb.Bin192]|nr:MAG: hypothetical protein BWY14_01313 [Parcubacteria group bacterium ADurb.Bin192]
MSETNNSHVLRVDKLGNSYYYFTNDITYTTAISCSGYGKTEITTYPPDWYLEMRRDRFRYDSHEINVSIGLSRLTPDEFALLQKILLKYGCIWGGSNLLSEHKTRHKIKKYNNKKMLICQKGKLSVVPAAKHRPESAVNFTQAVYQAACASPRAAIAVGGLIIRLIRPRC